MSTPIKKILFISFSAGAGHKRAAEALFLTCQQKYPQIQAEHIDLLDYSSGFFKKITASLYHFSVKYLPGIYDLVYKTTDYQHFANLLNHLSKILKFNNLKLHTFIKDYSPDLIIATHFIVPAVIKDIIKSIPLDMVITDYGLHGLWLAPNVRNFYVATPEMAIEMQNKKFKAFYAGLPVHPSFFEEKNLEELKNKFNLNPSYPTVLIMSGGFGLKNQSNLIEKIINDSPQTNLIVIAGQNNKILYKKYQKIKPSSDCNYQIIQFSKDIDELMKVADIIITKPGGITMTECDYLNKKIILTDPIPGQEEINEKYFCNKGLAEKINKKQIGSQIKSLLQKSNNPRQKNEPLGNEKILDISLN